MWSVIRVMGGAALAVLLAGGASAQDIDVGLRAGYLGSSLHGPGAGSTKGFESGVGGAYMTWHVRPLFAIQPEALLGRSGGYTSLAGRQQRFWVSQLQVPVLLKGVLPIVPHLEANVYAGPQVGLRLDCAYTTRLEYGQMSCAGDAGPVPAAEWSAVVGGAVGVTAGQARLLFDARYGHGLSSIFKSADGQTAKLRSFSAAFGAAIPVGPAPAAVALRGR